MIPVPDVSDIDTVFGGNAMKVLPPYKDIPDEFKVACAVTANGSPRA